MSALELVRPPRRDPRVPDASRHTSLGALLADALVQHKTETAFVERDRLREKSRLSYLDVRREVHRVAQWLGSIGVGAGDRVAILMTNQPRWPIAAMAALHRGAVLVPLDFKLTAVEHAQLLAHAKPKVLVVEHLLLTSLPELAVSHVLVSEAPSATPRASRWEDLPASVDAPPMVARRREDTATIVYSSGTGGRPKGCMLSHGAYLSQLDALTALHPLVRGDRYFSVLPTNHAIDFLCGFVGPLAGGATVVHQRTLRPEFLIDAMRAERVTHMAIVPLLLEAFERAVREKLDALPSWQRRAVDALAGLNGALTERAPEPALSRLLLKPVHDAFGGHLRVLFCGGAFVDRARAEFFYRLGLPVVIGYGLTEACTVATVNDLKPFRADSVGAPVRGVELRIDRPSEDGVGEVWLRGPTLMSGYLDDLELTRETLVDGWLRTGDLGSVDASGHLRLVGRSKNMIVTNGGKNVYPEDVENAFDGVDCEELVLFAERYVWPGAALDDDGLVVVVRPKKDLEVDALRAQLARQSAKLTDYRRPRSLLVWREPFPRTASMKVQRDRLAAVLREAVGRHELVALGGRS